VAVAAAKSLLSFKFGEEVPRRPAAPLHIYICVRSLIAFGIRAQNVVVALCVVVVAVLKSKYVHRFLLKLWNTFGVCWLTFSMAVAMAAFNIC
jgi:hypothetical protein